MFIQTCIFEVTLFYSSAYYVMPAVEETQCIIDDI